jgi:hypothetical protein
LFFHFYYAIQAYAFIIPDIEGVKMTNLITGAILILCTVFLAVHGSAGQDEALDMKAVAQLDQQATKVLKIDLNSLRWLLDASDEGYFLQSDIVVKNQLGAIETLQKNGYARVEVGVNEFPGGVRDAFLRIVPTEKGRRVIDLLTKTGN